jgi:ubiquinone/menaquinone biosynthesis C-methylase UbiE
MKPELHKSLDYSMVTETPGLPITREALSMMYTRYWLARSLASGRDVLEVACGAGQGLGFIASSARSVVGGDYTEPLLLVARRHYADRVPLVRLDAHRLPFRDRSFDLVILYEAIYYLRDPVEFCRETVRVLRAGGKLLICSANPKWPGFHASPLSVKYYDADGLRDLLTRSGFSCEVYGAFPVNDRSWWEKLLSIIRWIAVRSHLIPRTMKGRALLKRIFYQSLVPCPNEITEGIATNAPLVPLRDLGHASQFKVLYAVGSLEGSSRVSV